ncbi:DUF3951 domain-containing protein [Halobacillus salinus]|uniref:DUF3951 domain-containing protein n=1 Tax=Halobacillus salinus TaxID=192814 RepID=UPI00159260D2|nr:DUF3951 domain-containing protein [Halobacillus salinus]
MLLNVVAMTILGIGMLGLMLLVAYKVWIKKQPIDTLNSYTPFDYITGHSDREFHDDTEWIQVEGEGGDRPTS